MDIPITGAGLAFPTDVQAAASAYWRWQADQHNTIDGRTVTLTVSDDQFSSSVATQNCTQMSANSFLLLGYSGTSVIGACAAVGSRAGVPFVSRGLDPGFGQYTSYFAISPTYSEDGNLIARWVSQQMGGPGTKVSIVTYNTPQFDGLVGNFNDTARQLGFVALPAQRLSATAGAAESNAAALALRDAGAQVVVLDVVSAQLFTIFSTWTAQSFFPKIVMYGSAGQVPTICKTLGSNKGDVYVPNPWPQADYAAKAEPAFAQAVKKYGMSEADSYVDMAFWSEMEVVDQMLRATSTTGSLTRASFLNKVQTLSINTPLMGPIQYTPTNHLGSRAEYFLKANCATNTLDTVAKVQF
jgi:ABC-type branched-subunit amino acid transport system substrate-binding protein